MPAIRPPGDDDGAAQSGTLARRRLLAHGAKLAYVVPAVLATTKVSPVLARVSDGGEGDPASPQQRRWHGHRHGNPGHGGEDGEDGEDHD